MFVLDEVSSLQPRENVGGIATIARGEIVEFIIAPVTPHFGGGLHNIRCLAFYSCRC